MSQAANQPEKPADQEQSPCSAALPSMRYRVQLVCHLIAFVSAISPLAASVLGVLTFQSKLPLLMSGVLGGFILAIVCSDIALIRLWARYVALFQSEEDAAREYQSSTGTRP